MSVSSVKWVRLGDYIELCENRNASLAYGLDFVRGVSNTKQIMKTKADVTEDVIHKFYIINPGEFIYNPRTTRMGDKVGLGYNDTNSPLLFSFNNIAFCIKADAKSILLPEYLYIFYNRDEFDRYAIIHSWGSATELFTFEEMCDISIPLPSIEVQKELVNTYNGLKALAEQNEALIEPLSKACEAFIVDCKSKYDEVELGEYIEELNERNIDNEISLTQGVDVNMQFIPAKREAADKESAKIVRKGQFAFNRVVKANGTKLPIALRKGEDCIISSSYAVFQIQKTNELLSDFLFLWMLRKEFHRYCGYVSKGTTRDVFDFEDLCTLKFPLPPIEVQRSIVNLYNCLEEAKKIAQEAREKMKTLCPALVQRAANS